ncbi:MAG TPA: hypothetical protein VGJ79_14010 [Candidatus Dormibacteraeota bacterium]
MNKTRALLFGSLVAGAMLVGIVLGATILAKSSFSPANVFAATSTPPPAFKSNEDATHEKGETAAQEAAENSGQRPFGGGGLNGHSNETATHEAGESTAREAAENAAKPATATP